MIYTYKMSRCFATPSNLSAKEYTNKKSNLNLFCSLRQSFLTNNKKSIGTNVACLKDNGTISSFKNQSSQLKIKKGYEYFSQNYKTDLSFNYVGQIMKNHLCTAYDIALDNTDLSNNFTTGVPIHTRAQGTSLAQTVVVDMSGNNPPVLVNRYAEIDHNTPSELSGGYDGFGTTTKKFKDKKKIIYDYCAVKKSSNINVLLPTD